MSTNVLSDRQIQRTWHLIDAKDQILGRLAGSIASLLMGKNKANFVPYLDNGDNVIVINASQVRVTGKKEEQKEYVRHSGFPGGLRKETLAELRAQKPAQLITHAVSGMIPKSKLGRQMIKKLHVYSEDKHPYEDKLSRKSKD